jgi:hypothetical protein
MKRYLGTRFDGATGTFAGKAQVVVVEGDGRAWRLAHRVRHSPCGFEWGYRGSGPADLARCILIDHLEDPDPPPVLYQRFMTEVIAGIGGDPWVLTAKDIATWLGRVLRSREGSAQRPEERIPPWSREGPGVGPNEVGGDDRPHPPPSALDGEGGEAGCRS